MLNSVTIIFNTIDCFANIRQAMPTGTPCLSTMEMSIICSLFVIFLPLPSPPRSLSLAIATILLVAFFEYPSSITSGNSSDPRYRGQRLNPPCGVMEAIEITCLLIFTADLGMKVKSSTFLAVSKLVATATAMAGCPCLLWSIQAWYSSYSSLLLILLSYLD